MNLPLVLLNRRRRGGLDAYREGGFNPALVFDFDDEYYRTGGSTSTFSDAITHSRTSNATMVDSDGVLKWAPHNLLLRSEEFDNASWSKSNVTVTANAAVAPDGTTTADKVINTGDTGGKLLHQAGVATGQTTISVFAKAAEFTRLRINEISGNRFSANFDLSAETATLTSGVNGIAARILSVGDGWYLCEIDHSATSAANSIVGYPNSAEVTAGNPNYDADDVSGIYIWGAHLYRSDLGGMVNNPDRGDSYVPTTSSARYLARRGHHIYNGTAWVNEGMLHESEARTNLLLNSGTLATQNVTVTAVPHTLHFTGTGTVTLLGASTDGPLVGTGTGENNRVSLTFTPTAGTLTLTVFGTVTNAQLEAAPTPSSYIPTSGATATRAADTLTVPSANLPWSSDAVSIQMQGRATGDTYTTTRWYLDANNYITQEINSSDFTFEQAASGTVDAVTGGSFTSGVNTSFNFASTHASTLVAAAVGGTALTDNTTPVALPNLSATDLNLGHSFMGTLKLMRVWSANITEAGREEAST